MTVKIDLNGKLLAVSLTKDMKVVSLFADGFDTPLTCTISDTLLSAELPDSFFDGRQRQAKLVYTQKNERKIAVFNHRSCYRGALSQSDGFIKGHIYDETRPDTPIELYVELNGAFLGQVVADQTVVMSEAALEGAPSSELSDCGFRIALPFGEEEMRPQILGLRLKGTDAFPLGQFLINITQAAYSLPERDLALSPQIKDWLLVWRRQQAQGLTKTITLPALMRLSQQDYGTKAASRVDLCLVVGPEDKDLEGGIKTLLQARTSLDYSLQVITSLEVGEESLKILRHLSVRYDFKLHIANDKVALVPALNEAMVMSCDNDVVIMSASCEPGEDWLDRLRFAAYAEGGVASVSPLSNRAGLSALPHLEGTSDRPYGLEVEALNTACGVEFNKDVLCVPHTDDHCVFIRREALKVVGALTPHLAPQEDLSLKHYLIDFCLRASHAGFVHRLALCVYVQNHTKPAASSAEDKRAHKALLRLHPDYANILADHLAHDPMAHVRNRLQIAKWQGQPTMVIISLSIGGGVEINLKYLADRLVLEGVRVLVLKRSKARDYAYEMNEWNGTERLLYLKSAILEVVCADLVMLNPQRVHVRHLIDFEDGLDAFLIQSRLPYVVSLHDYFYLNPRLNLLDETGEYCPAGDTARWNACLATFGGHPALHKSLQTFKDLGVWQNKWRTFLAAAKAVIAPDESVKTLYQSVFPNLDIKVRPYLGPDRPTVKSVPRQESADEILKVAVIGNLVPEKGVHRLLKLMRWAQGEAKHLRFELFGYAPDKAAFLGLENVTCHGAYKPNELKARLSKSGARVALFLSPWPEAYAFTLTEALQNGLTPVGLDLGAIGARIKALGVGRVLDPDVGNARLSEALVEASRIDIEAGTYSEGRYPSLKEDYYNFTAQSEDTPGCVFLPALKGITEDRWCYHDATFYFAARAFVNRLKIDFFIPAHFGAQFVRLYINHQLYAHRELPADGLRRMETATKPLKGLIRVDLRFAFVERMSRDDKRACAARLSATSFELSDEPVMAEPIPNPISMRLRHTPDANIRWLTEAHDNGELDQLYRDVTQYSLFKPQTGFGDALKGVLSDLSWSVRLLRHQGPKKALRSLMSMRYLRKGGFDATFYRLQQLKTSRTNMDPITHYVVFGANDGLDPAPGFSTRFYQKANEDTQRHGINPFYHYLRFGHAEMRRTEPSEQVGLFFKAQASRIAHLTSAEPHPEDRFFEAEAHPHLSHSPQSNLVQGLTHAVAAPDWPKRDTGKDSEDLYGVRPDDAVVDEAYRGESFLSEFKLLSQHPQWEKAVARLNAHGFHTKGQPEISIIMPIYGQLAYTLNCLDALLAHQTTHSFEILIGDDASTDESQKWLSKLNSVGYIRYDRNEGFIANCNKTAGRAKGKTLVFLNNDTRVVQAWLDALMAGFRNFSNAGLVGSKLFYPDSSLQEAGGIVWADGSAWNYGRHDDPNRPEYCYARKVDYISGASIAIHKMLWDRLGGFDMRYAPAYYEDTDLAFKVQKFGLDCIMQPTSKIIHYEGKTSGTDTSGGIKANQVKNQAIFLDQWGTQLRSHRDNGAEVLLERERSVKKRVLIIDAVNPRIGEDAGSNATLALMRFYQALGYKVGFVPEDNFLYEPNEVRALQEMGVQVFYAPFYRSVAQVLNAEGAHLDIVHLIRPTVAHKYLNIIRMAAPEAKIAYLNADLHYLRLERQAEVEKDEGLKVEAETMRAKELETVAGCDLTLVHSSVEKEILELALPESRITVLPLIDKVVESDAPHMLRMDLMFLGSYNHHPNTDAALWLLDHIWPKLAEALPHARLWLVGSNPPESVLARANDRVLVTGRVEDLSEPFEQTRLFLAALRYGAGAKGKILSALSCGVPVVATSIAAEGMPFEVGKSIFIADAEEDFIKETLRLYNLSAEEWQALSHEAKTYVRTHHSFEAGLAALKQALDVS